MRSILTSVLALAIAGPVAARDLVINFDDLNPAPKAAFEAAVATCLRAAQR